MVSMTPNNLPVTDCSVRPRRHVGRNCQADRLAVVRFIMNSNLIGCSTREIYGFGNLSRLISVVALFVGCATMAMFFRMLLIWDCST